MASSSLGRCQVLTFLIIPICHSKPFFLVAQSIFQFPNVMIGRNLGCIFYAQLLSSHEEKLTNECELI